MKQFYLLLYFLLGCCACSCAQADLQYRVLLIGDAGEINPQQQAMILDAAAKAIPGKTIVLFLGDNIYPRGLETLHFLIL